MSSPYRSRQPANSYLTRICEAWRADTVLAPDITTARERERGPVTITAMADAEPTPQAAQLAIPAAPPAPAARVPKNEPRPSAIDDNSIVETRHPEIARAISLLWGFPEMNEYFDRLWLADGNHGPIDPDAMSELMLLARVHQSILPHRPGRSLASLYGANPLAQANDRPRDPWRDVPPRR